MSRHRTPAFDAAFWFQWIMATTLGWLLGGVLFANLPLVAGGVGVGILQWPILYTRIAKAWRWTLATAGGWIAGTIVVLVVLPVGLEGILAGLSVGLAQWLILRREVHWAGWWIVISAMAWITGLTLVPGSLTTGALSGALTGVALMLLFRYPKATAGRVDG
jgi:hypothetical protein